MDVALNTPNNDFKDLLSILPNAYTKDFGNVRADGKFQLDGFAKGVFNANKEAYPSFLIDLQVEKANVKYPALAMPIADINIDMSINKPEGGLDATMLDINKFAMKVGGDPIDGYLKLRTPLSDPDLDTRINANLNLKNLSRAYPMNSVKEMAGRIVADVTAKVKQSDIERENYAAVDMRGQVVVQDVLYVATGMPNVELKNGLLEFAPQFTELINFDARLGKSDLYATAKIYNPLAYLTDKQTMRGEARLRSNYFNADEWLTTEEVPSGPAVSTVPTTTTNSPIEDGVDIKLDVEMRKIDYDVYSLADLRAKAKVTFNELEVQESYTEVNGSDISTTGHLKNVYNFAMNGGTLAGNLDMRSSTFDLDKLLYSEGTAADANADEVEVSAGTIPDFKYDLDINAMANSVLYAPYRLTNFVVKGKVTEQKLALDNFSLNIKDSDIRGNGEVRNYMQYVFAADTVRGTFDIAADFLNLNSIMASDAYMQNIGDDTPETAEPEDLEAYILDPKWDFVVNSRLKRVLYTDMDMRNLQGKMTIRKGRLLFENTSAELLDGSMALTGGYDTSEPESPYFDMKYTLDQVSFAQAFNTFNTFKILAPIGKFVDGKVDFDLVFNSVLGQDMMPDLMTINSDGFITTVGAFLKGFKPLQSIGNQLGVDAGFNEFEIRDSKNWFSIENGTVKIDNIALINSEGIDLSVSGTHGLNQDMDYVIEASIPKEKLG
ncbi:MAG: AsmA-like C-terminal region-containing protein, partial [Bacteroidota bacterium]